MKIAREDIVGWAVNVPGGEKLYCIECWDEQDDGPRTPLTAKEIEDDNDHVYLCDACRQEITPTMGKGMSWEEYQASRKAKFREASKEGEGEFSKCSDCGRELDSDFSWEDAGLMGSDVNDDAGYAFTVACSEHHVRYCVHCTKKHFLDWKRGDKQSAP